MATTTQKYPAHVELTNPTGGLTSISIDAIDGNFIVNVADLHGGVLLGNADQTIDALLHDEVATTLDGKRLVLARYRLVGLQLVSTEYFPHDGPRIDQMYTGWLTEIRGHMEPLQFEFGPHGNTEELPPIIPHGAFPLRVQVAVSTTVAVTPTPEGRPDHDY